MTFRKPTKRLVDTEVTMPFEKNTEVVGMLAFVNANQTVMDVGLHGGIIEDTLRKRVSIGGLCDTGCWYLHLACSGARS
jgi:hypothetical protein